MEPILQIENLSISFTQYSRGTSRWELQVIRDLSLSLFSGEVLAVVGASGSGKVCWRMEFWDCCPITATVRERFFTREALSLKSGCRSCGEGRLSWCPKASPIWIR